MGGSLAAQTKDPGPLNPLPLGRTLYPPPLEHIPPPTWLRLGNNLLGLDLTSEQKKAIQQLQESDALSLLSASDGVRLARTILESALRENPQDEIGSKAKYEELAKSEAKLSEQQSIHETKLMQVLTIEQRAKLSDIPPIEPGFEGVGPHRPIPPPPDQFDLGPETDDDPTLDLDFDDDFD
jgi:Spy/CpxP family protein refolding chaperone